MPVKVTVYMDPVTTHHLALTPKILQPARGTTLMRVFEGEMDIQGEDDMALCEDVFFVLNYQDESRLPKGYQPLRSLSSGDVVVIEERSAHAVLSIGWRKLDAVPEGKTIPTPDGVPAPFSFSVAEEARPAATFSVA